MDVRIERRREGDRRVDRPITRYILVFARSLPVAFRVRRENLLSSLGRAIGVRDAELGDADFDRLARLEGDAAALRHFLGSRRRKILTDFLEAYPNSEINEDGIAVERQGYARDSAEIIGTLRAMLALTEALGRSEGQVREGPPAESAAERRPPRPAERAPGMPRRASRLVPKARASSDDRRQSASEPEAEPAEPAPEGLPDWMLEQGVSLPSTAVPGDDPV